MNRNITNFIITLILAIVLSQFLPWYSVILAAFLSAITMPLKKGCVFLIPFSAIALLWITHSFWLSSANDFILAKKIAVLLPLSGNIYLLILVTGIVGGIAAGVAAVFGKQCVLLQKK